MGIFNKVKENKNLSPGTPGKHPGNTQETPRKHPGKVHSLMFCIKGAGLEKTSLAKVVGIRHKHKNVARFEKFN